MNIIKRIGLSIVLGFVATTAQAIPTLFFDGSINYLNEPTSGGVLAVDGQLFDTQGITPKPNVVGSTISFGALFDHAITVAGSTPFSATATRGYFNSAPQRPLTIYDGDNNLLLSATLNDLILEGVNGLDNGSITAVLQATNGTLMSMFDGADLFALQLNLNTTFSIDMFDTSFSGRVDGNIKAQTVPEPSLVALLAIGILGVACRRRIKF